jgi:hypothetical protein
MARLVAALVAIDGLGKLETARLLAADLDLAAERLAIRRSASTTLLISTTSHASWRHGGCANGAGDGRPPPIRIY